MSVVFYRRPDYVSRPDGPLNKTECARYVEKYMHLQGRTPPELSFENVIANKPLPPCTLNDFLDYLIYVERNAENLQFYLWLRDYKARFDALPESEQRLSPPWTDYNTLPPDFQSVRGVRNRSSYEHDFTFSSGRSSDDGRPLSQDGSRHASQLSHGSVPSITDVNSITTAPTTIKTMATIAEDANANVGLRWQGFSVQPFRDEVTRVIAHYIAPGGPRELNLSHRDRATVLHALQHTTHPSAFDGIHELVEAILKGQAHPNFVRWSVCNANKPKMLFVRALGVLGILGGLLAMLLLILSRVPRWWRILPSPLLWIGLTSVIASLKGLCMILKFHYQRDLKPWELEHADPASTYGLICKPLASPSGHSSRTYNKRRHHLSSVVSRDSSHPDGGGGGGGGVPWSYAQMGPSVSDVASQHDDDDVVGPAAEKQFPLDTFGAGNDWDHEAWVERGQRRPLVRQIFPGSVWVQEDGVRRLQWKIMRESEVYALVVTVALTAGLTAVPKGNFY